MPPKFKTLNESEQQEIIAMAKTMVQRTWDTFFTTMLKEKGEEATMKSAIDIATNLFLKSKFHAQFGEREIH
jgi:hypothetical protein